MLGRAWKQNMGNNNKYWTLGEELKAFEIVHR